MTRALIIGGSGGLGRAMAETFAKRGDAVLVTSRDRTRAEAIAAEIGENTEGLALDLARPEEIEHALAGVGEVDHLVITAIHQALNSVAKFSIADAVHAATVKLVGCTEAVRVMRDRLRPNGSIVLMGGISKLRPYPGSTLTSANNGGVSALVRTLAVELAPIRVSALHPGVVGDSPAWRQRTPMTGLDGRTVTMSDVVDATVFLLRNQSVNGIDLYLDGGHRHSRS